MPQQMTVEVEGRYTLPPLILHPFTGAASAIGLVESAKASLEMLKDGRGAAGQRMEIERRLLEGRYAELRMLFYVGKDVTRWLDQCVEVTSRQDGLQTLPITEQSFANLLIKQTPTDVAEKLVRWGVAEYARIFSRSIGVYSQFSEPPEQSLLQPEYIKNYYKYADYAFACWKVLKKYPVLPAEQFPFTLYASGEYTQMLEEEWKEAGEG